jgi:hypothetical protein
MAEGHRQGGTPHYGPQKGHQGPLMPSPLVRKPRELPPELVQTGLALFWGFGILGGLVYLGELAAFIRCVATSSDMTSLLTKGFSLFDLFFLLAVILNYFLFSRQTYPRISSLLSGLCAGLVLKDLVVLLDPNFLLAQIAAFLFSALAAFITYQYFMRHKANIPLSQKEIPDVDYGASPLQVDEEGNFYIPSKACEYHIQVCGGTGSGKTYNVIKPFIRQDIVTNRIGAFIYDVKSNLAKDIAFYVDEAGREKDFKYFDLGNPAKSMTWNPLYSGTADEIADKVYCALYYESDKASQYYSELGSAFLHNLISLLKMEKDVLTFQDLFNATSELDTFKTLNRLCQKHSQAPQARFFTSNWLQKPMRQRQEELTGLINKLQRFCTREWAPLINTTKPDIRMNEVLDYNQILLFGIAAPKYPDDARPLSIMAIMDIAQQVAARFSSKPSKTFRVYLDEFYHLAYSGFIKTLNLAREARVSFVLAHQALADLGMVSEEFAQQVSINTRNKVVLTQDDSHTAEYFAELLGTEIDLDTKVYSFDTRQSPLFATPAGYTMPQQHKFRFNPNEIKELPLGEALVRTVFPTGPIIRRIKLPKARIAPNGFNLDGVLKTLNNHLKQEEQKEPEERLDLLKERKRQEPEDPRIKALNEKYSRGRKTPKRD